jgi:hypothetical protein
MEEKIYVVGYGDCECWNILKVFSTLEKAKEYLKPYKDLEDIHGKNFIFGFYPSIDEIVIDDVADELKFLTRVAENSDGSYHAFTTVMKIYDTLDSTKRFYCTNTVDKDKAIEEAKEYFRSLEDE